MNKIHLLLIFIYLINVLIYSSNDNSIYDYYGGDKITSDKRDGTQSTSNNNNCICALGSDSCEEFCCCDPKCPEDAKKDWTNHLRCIDRENVVGIFADRCIDKNLVFRNNTRRGLKTERQTEDIKQIEDRTIENYCYSIDNSGQMKNDLIIINELEDYINVDNELFDMVANRLLDSTTKENSGISQGVQIKLYNHTQKESFINITETTLFQIKDSDLTYLSLYSGVHCSNLKIVEKLKPENYTCILDTEITIDNLRTITINDIACERKIWSGNDDNLISEAEDDSGCTGNRISEVKFVLNLEKEEKINKCKLYILCLNTENNIFKNSVVFTKDNRLPYKYSGNIGYLNNYPLKIADENEAYNEYYIVGRDTDGNCRNKDGINSYLYNYDQPILYNQNLIYSCNLQDGQKYEDTALFKKIQNIIKIGKYGSSSYTTINDDKDWVKIDNSGNQGNLIFMDVYIGTNKIGFYSYKYIHKANIRYEESTTRMVRFELKYYDLEGFEDDSDEKYKERPFFLPPIPPDLLEPLIYSNVDK